MHHQSSGVAERAGLAVAILRRKVNSTDRAASSVRVDYSGKCVQNSPWPTLAKVKAHRLFSEATDAEDYLNIAGSTMAYEFAKRGAQLHNIPP
eukprot:5851192-Pyramimonas_sp.AAC.1